MRSAVFPSLHVVTNDAVLGRPDFVDQALAVLSAEGAHVAVHVRGPHTAGGRVFQIVDALLARRAGLGSIYVNDRIDVAMALPVDGVHLGARSLPLASARRLLGPSRRIGISAHGALEVADAIGDGADYVFVGTVFATLSHPGVAGGGAGLVRASRSAGGDRPLVAIGGIGPGQAGELVAAGADGVAVIRGVWDAPDPGRAAAEYVEAVQRGRSNKGLEAKEPK